MRAVPGILAATFVALVAANVWPLLLAGLGLWPAVAVELAFLALFILWASGRGGPLRLRPVRVASFRRLPRTVVGWGWALVAALAFAVAVHTAMVLLFRVVEFPRAAFRSAYPFPPMSGAGAWVLFVVSGLSAGVCEEVGFRGWVQQPLERRLGVAGAIAISTACFTLLHLNQAWATLGMLPIVAGAGVLLGLLAWRSDSLVPGIAGHVAMDIGMFSYWWSGYLGDFTLRPLRESGIDVELLAAVCAFVAALVTLGIAAAGFRRSFAVT